MENQERVWDNIAEKWNEFREIVSPTVMKFLKDKRGTILDLGCGSGRNFSAMNQNVGLYAVDFSKKMVSLAKQKAEGLKLKSEIIQSISDKLPFEDNFFDSAICVAVLHCIPTEKERKETIKEIFRTLKPECEALISSWGKQSPRLKNKPKECFVSWTIKSNKKFREGEQDIKQERYTYVYDLEELKQEVLDAGFKIEKVWEERNINVICRKS